MTALNALTRVRQCSIAVKVTISLAWERNYEQHMVIYSYIIDYRFRYIRTDTAQHGNHKVYSCMCSRKCITQIYSAFVYVMYGDAPETYDIIPKKIAYVLLLYVGLTQACPN